MKINIAARRMRGESCGAGDGIKSWEEISTVVKVILVVGSITDFFVLLQFCISLYPQHRWHKGEQVSIREGGQTVQSAIVGEGNVDMALGVIGEEDPAAQVGRYSSAASEMLGI